MLFQWNFLVIFQCNIKLLMGLSISNSLEHWWCKLPEHFQLLTGRMTLQINWLRGVAGYSTQRRMSKQPTHHTSKVHSWMGVNMLAKDILTFLFPCKRNKILPVFLFQCFLLQISKESLSVKSTWGLFSSLVFLSEACWQKCILQNKRKNYDKASKVLVYKLSASIQSFFIYNFPNS